MKRKYRIVERPDGDYHYFRFVVEFKYHKPWWDLIGDEGTWHWDQGFHTLEEAEARIKELKAQDKERAALAKKAKYKYHYR